jgi:hypothetical protein
MSNPLAVTYVDLVGPPVSAAWLNAVTQAVSGSQTPTTITATAGQTVFTVPATAVGQVYINGVYQIPNDSYVRTNDTTITFSEGVPVNAKVTVL